ncbi:hypothetical protein [Phytobacter sp. V91]|uniref:hypothetical protein n=1 Tax=Phytobacter sp. V91 TaxID=3369425 RepID=UPI003F618BC6
MKRTVLSLVILSALSATGAHAQVMSTVVADHNVQTANANYADAERQYNDAARTLGSGIKGSPEEANMVAAGARRAQAYADQRAAVANEKNKAQHAADIKAHEDAMDAQTKIDVANDQLHNKQFTTSTTTVDLNRITGHEGAITAQQPTTQRTDISTSTGGPQSVISTSNGVPISTGTTSQKPSDSLPQTTVSQGKSSVGGDVSLSSGVQSVSDNGITSSTMSNGSTSATTGTGISITAGITPAGANKVKNTNMAVAKADAIQNSYDHPVRATDAYGNALTHANQVRTNDQAVAKADAMSQAQDRADRDAKAKAAAGNAKGGSFATGKGDDLNTSNVGHPVEATHEVATDHSADAAKAHGAQLSDANRDRTSSQHTSQSTLTHETATAHPDTTAASQAAEQAAHAARYRMNTQPAVTITQPAKVSVSMSTLTPASKPTTVTKPAETIGVKTPVETVPATVTNVTTPVVSVPFVDKKGGNGKASASHGEHGTGAGADNAHDHAFGGHTGAGGGYHY